MQLQELFIVQFTSILSVVIPLERPTKTPFQETLLKFLVFCDSVLL